MNFINPIPPHEQKQIAQWYRLSALLFAGTCCVIFALHAWQLRKVLVLKAEYTKRLHTTKNYSTLLDKHQLLTKQHETLSTYCQEATRITQALERFMTYLHALDTTITTPANLTSCSLADKTFNATIHCPTLASGITVTHSLAQQTGIKNLKITSAQPSPNKTTIIMLHGTLTA